MKAVTIPGWAFALAGPLVFVASLIVSYTVQAETIKTHTARLEQLEERSRDIETIRLNIERLCERLQVDCR